MKDIFNELFFIFLGTPNDRCSLKKVFLKSRILEKCMQNTWGSFLSKVAGCRPATLLKTKISQKLLVTKL